VPGYSHWGRCYHWDPCYHSVLEPCPCDWRCWPCSQPAPAAWFAARGTRTRWSSLARTWESGGGDGASDGGGNCYCEGDSDGHSEGDNDADGHRNDDGNCDGDEQIVK
jgi:hypothetical protein